MSRLEFVSPEGLRLDGRRPRELRHMECKSGPLSGADGSAFVSQGNTKCLATVYGPREPRNRANVHHDRVVVNCEYSVASFSSGDRRSRTKGDRKGTEISLMLRRTLEEAILTTAFPRAQIDVFVHVLQSDGSELAACINAATMALIDAGVPMLDHLVACTAGCIDGVPILDVNHVEKSAEGPNLSLALFPRSGKIVMLQMDSRLHMDQLESVMELATDGCQSVFELMEQVVRHRTRELAQGLQ